MRYGYLHKKPLGYEPFNPMFYSDEWKKDENKKYNNFHVRNPIHPNNGNTEDWRPYNELEMCPRCGITIIKHWAWGMTIAIVKRDRQNHCNRCGYSYPREWYLRSFKKFMIFQNEASKEIEHVA